jgi:hypothetical protein
MQGLDGISNYLPIDDCSEARALAKSNPEEAQESARNYSVRIV